MDIATEESEEGNVTLFNKKLNKLLNKARIQAGACDHCSKSAGGLNSISVLPTLLQDIVDRADKWGNDGKNGRIDPFTEIYDVRLLAAHISI